MEKAVENRRRIRERRKGEERKRGRRLFSSRKLLTNLTSLPLLPSLSSAVDFPLPPLDLTPLPIPLALSPPRRRDFPLKSKHALNVSGSFPSYLPSMCEGKYGNSFMLPERRRFRRSNQRPYPSLQSAKLGKVGKKNNREEEEGGCPPPAQKFN